MTRKNDGVGRAPIERRQFMKGAAFAGALAAAPGLLAACGSSSGSSSSGAGGAGGGSAGSMNYGIAQALDVTADPLQKTGANMSYAAWDSLTYVAPKAPIAPLLAQSWSRVSDTVTEFKLNPKAIFSNGQPVTSADVAFSIEAILTNNYQLAPDIASISKVTPVGAHTVQITTTTPDALLEKRLGLVFIVPAAYYKNLGPNGFSAKPIGSGRYIVSNFVANQSVSFEANPKSWRGQPATPKVHFTEFGDESAFLDAFLAGQIDVAQALPSTGIPQLGRDSNAVTNLALDGSAVVMGLDTTKPPFNDVRVRRAVNMAINNQQMIDKVLNGAGRPLGSQLPGPDTVGYDPSLQPYPYDPAGAKALLASAGHAGGFSTTIAGLDVNQPAMQAVSGYLQAIGIKATVLTLPFPVWVKQFVNGSPYGLYTTGLYQGPFYDADFAFQWATIGSHVKGGRPNWVNAKWDSMLAAERAELDAAKRLTLLQQMSAYLKDQARYLFLYEEKLVYGISKQVKHFDPSTGLYMLVDSATKSA